MAYLDDKHIYNGYVPVVCKGQRLMYDTKGNITLDCKKGQSYAVQEMRFEYEDSNLPWDAFCKNIGFLVFSSFLGRMGGERFKRDEYSFLLRHADVIMCLDQGFKPEIPEENKAIDQQEYMARYYKRLKEYKRGMFSDRVK